MELISSRACIFVLHMSWLSITQEHDTPNTQDFWAKIVKTFAQKPHETNKDNDTVLSTILGSNWGDSFVRGSQHQQQRLLYIQRYLKVTCYIVSSLQSSLGTRSYSQKSMSTIDQSTFFFFFFQRVVYQFITGNFQSPHFSALDYLEDTCFTFCWIYKYLRLTQIQGMKWVIFSGRNSKIQKTAFPLRQSKGG